VCNEIHTRHRSTPRHTLEFQPFHTELGERGGGPRRTWTAEPGVNTFFLTFNGRAVLAPTCEWDGEWDDFAR